MQLDTWKTNHLLCRAGRSGITGLLKTQKLAIIPKHEIKLTDIPMISGWRLLNSKIKKIKTIIVTAESSVSEVLVNGSLWVEKKCLAIKKRLLKNPKDKEKKAAIEKKLGL